MQQGSIAAPLPDRQVLRQEVAQQCPDVPPQVLDEVFAQLDDDYFRVFTVAQIATHVRLLAAVDDQHPVQIRVVSRHAQRAEILVAAYDLFGEFSIITGLMTAYGLNIRDGQVYAGHEFLQKLLLEFMALGVIPVLPGLFPLGAQFLGQAHQSVFAGGHGYCSMQRPQRFSQGGRAATTGFGVRGPARDFGRRYRTREWRPIVFPAR